MSSRKLHLRTYQVLGWSGREVWEVLCGALWVSNSADRVGFDSLPKSGQCANCRRKAAEVDEIPS